MKLIDPRTWRRGVAVFALPLMLFLAASPVSATEGPFWKVTGPNGTRSFPTCCATAPCAPC